MKNVYLIISIVLVFMFFCYKKTNNTPKSNFNNTTKSNFSEIKNEDKQVYHLDTRFEYPTIPPVNPIAYKSLVVNNVPVDKGLYSNQEIGKMGYILDQNNVNVQYNNQLETSGGNMELIKIPLQFNDPYDEQLRTQEILITPYNRIKYKNC
jgi:hypothetical protein